MKAARTSLSSHHPVWLLAPLIGVLVLGHCLTNDFAWDDTEYILQNKAVQSLRNVPRFFTLRYWTEERPTTISSYRPLREISVALDYARWGANPAGYRLTSVVTHLAAVLGVYLLARGHVPGGRAAAMLAASVYAIHPSRVETLATIENRAEIFVACLVIGSTLCWIRWARDGTRARWGWHAAATIAFVLALMSKNIAVMLPLALAAAAIYLPRLAQPTRTEDVGSAPRMRAASIVLLFLLGATFVIACLLLIKREAVPVERLGELPLAWQPALVMETLMAYLKMAVLPINAHADRVLPIPQPPLIAWYAGLGGVVLLGAAGVRAQRWRRGVAPFGVAWFLVFLLPVLNCPVIEGRPLAEQRLYLPLAGLCLCVGVAVAGRPAWRAGVMGVLLAYSALTGSQVFAWSGNRALWYDNVAKAPDNARARNNLGMEYYQLGAWHQAEIQLRVAVRSEPRDPVFARNFASVCKKQGRLDEALVWLRRTLEMRPRDPEVWGQVAKIHSIRKEWRKAKAAFESVVGLKPGAAGPQSNLAGVCVALGEYGEAEAALKRALQLRPGDGDLYANLGQVYHRWGRPGPAQEACKRAVELAPASSLAFVRLGEVMDGLGRHTEAADAYRRSLELNPDNREARDLLRRMRAPERGETEDR